MTDEQFPRNDEDFSALDNEMKKSDQDLDFGITDGFPDPWEEEYTSVDTDFKEETAAEFATARPLESDVNKERVFEDDNDVTSGRGVGLFAIVLSIMSLFFLPVFLGIAGIVVGFISRRLGAKALGNWAIGIGAVAIIMTVFFSPFF